MSSSEWKPSELRRKSAHALILCPKLHIRRQSNEKLPLHRVNAIMRTTLGIRAAPSFACGAVSWLLWLAQRLHGRRRVAAQRVLQPVASEASPRRLGRTPPPSVPSSLSGFHPCGLDRHVHAIATALESVLVTRKHVRAWLSRLISHVR